MRSVVVVLPASMWAMMPMLRYRSRGVVRGMGELRRARTWALPAVVREGLVRVGHTMGVLPLLHGGAAVVRGIEQFPRQSFLHGVLGAVARGADEPADRQRLAALRAHLDRHLI